MKNNSHWPFRLAVAANISQVLSLFFQVWGVPASLPPFLNPLVLLIATIVGILAAVWVILQPHPLTTLRSEKTKRLGRLTAHANIVLAIFAIFLLYVGFQAHRILSTSRDKFTVIVTDFSERGNPTSTDRTISQLIVNNLQQDIGGHSEAEIVPVFEPVEDLNSRSAIEIGSRYGATIVIWGWYTIRQNDVLIDPHFEILTSDPVLQPFRLHRQVIPRSSFESFDFELTLSSEYSYLSAFTIGMIRYSQQKYTDSIAILSSIIEQSETAKNIPLVYNMRGLSYKKSGQHQEALRDYLRAIELSPTNPVYYYNLGSCQLDIGEVENAVTNFELAVELDPHFPLPLNSLAIVYHDKRDLALAEYYYNQAIQLAPYETIYRTNLAELYVEREEYDHALEQIDAALQSASMDSSLHFRKALILVAQQRWGFALWGLILCLYYSAPVQWTILIIIIIGLSVLYIVDRRQNGRISTWLLPRILSGISAVILIMFGFKKRRSTEYRNNTIIRILAFGVLLQFRSYLISDDESRAKSLVEAAIARGIQNTELLTSLGIFYFEQHKFDLAARVFSEVLKVDKYNGHAYFGLGRIYAENDDIPAALLCFQHATSSPEYEAAAWLLAGDIHWKHRDIRGALVSWSKAVKKDPQYVVERTLQGFSQISQLLSPSEHFKLGLAFNQMGAAKRAATGFENALKYGKYTPVAMHAEFRLRSLRQA